MNDHNFSEEDRSSITELNRKIGLIKQNQLPEVFKAERQRILNRAETARVGGGDKCKFMLCALCCKVGWFIFRMRFPNGVT